MKKNNVQFNFTGGNVNSYYRCISMVVAMVVK